MMRSSLGSTLIGSDTDDEKVDQRFHKALRQPGDPHRVIAIMNTRTRGDKYCLEKSRKRRDAFRRVVAEYAPRSIDQWK